MEVCVVEYYFEDTEEAQGERGWRVFTSIDKAIDTIRQEMKKQGYVDISPEDDDDGFPDYLTDEDIREMMELSRKHKTLYFEYKDYEIHKDFYLYVVELEE